MQQQSNSNNCGKVCLWSCLGCVGLLIAFSILIWVGACMGCQTFGGLFSAIGNTAKIQGYFEDLKADGWEVDDTQSNQPSGYGVNAESSQPMIWKARENPEDDWTLYVWELAPADPEAIQNMTEGEGEMDWTALMNWTLIPRTDAALEVHEELGLPLPDDFELIPWDEESGTNSHDKIHGDDEEDSGNNDEETGNNDDEEQTVEGDKPGNDDTSNSDDSGSDDESDDDSNHRQPKHPI